MFDGVWCHAETTEGVGHALGQFVRFASKRPQSILVRVEDPKLGGAEQGPFADGEQAVAVRRSYCSAQSKKWASDASSSAIMWEGFCGAGGGTIHLLGSSSLVSADVDGSMSAKKIKHLEDFLDHNAKEAALWRNCRDLALALAHPEGKRPIPEGSSDIVKLVSEALAREGSDGGATVRRVCCWLWQMGWMPYLHRAIVPTPLTAAFERLSTDSTLLGSKSHFMARAKAIGSRPELDCAFAGNSADVCGVVMQAPAGEDVEAVPLWDTSHIPGMKEEQTLTFVPALANARRAASCSSYISSQANHALRGLSHSPVEEGDFDESGMTAEDVASIKRSREIFAKTADAARLQPDQHWVPVARDLFDVTNPWTTSVSLRAMSTIANGNEVLWKDRSLPVRVLGQIVSDFLRRACDGDQGNVPTGRFLEIARAWVLQMDDFFVM